MDAALFSNTPVTAYMDMSVRRFHEFWQAICAVAKRRSEARQRATEAAKKSPPKPRKAKRKRKR